MLRKLSRSLALLCLAGGVVAGSVPVAGAADPPPTEPKRQAGGETLPGDESLPAEARHPLSAQILDLQKATALRLAELNTLRAAALDAPTRLGLEREIRRVKLDFELGVLGLQLDHLKARVAAGTAAEKSVTDVEAAIEALRVQRDAEQQ